MSKPLGEYREFKKWNRPVPWGPGETSRATFGAGVVADLCLGIREFRSAVADEFIASRARDSGVVALGCVAWFTSTDVAQALIEAAGDVLILVDKGAAYRGAIQRLVQSGRTFDQSLILPYHSPLDAMGRTAVIDPYTSELPGEREIAPVRFVGWRPNQESDEPSPLLHAKLLVLAICWWGEDDFGYEYRGVTPLRVWIGSANWTVQSPLHLECGVWSADRTLCEAAWSFLTDAVAFSEPLDTPTNAPEPELVAAEWDDDAFREAAAAQREAAEWGDEDDED